MKHLIASSALVLLAAVAAIAAPPRRGDRSEEIRRLRRASEVFNEIMSTPDKGIPPLSHSYCTCDDAQICPCNRTANDGASKLNE